MAATTSTDTISTKQPLSVQALTALVVGSMVGAGIFIVIDQRFAQRGRLGRLLAALVQQPALLGVRIDEDTAIIVKGDEFEVVGQEATTVVVESTVTRNNLHGLLKDEMIPLCGVKRHILPYGYQFNLKTHLPTV